ERRATTAETATVALQLVALATVCSWTVVDLDGRGTTTRWQLAALFLGVLLLAGFLAAPTVAWAFFGRRFLPGLARRPRLSAVVRGPGSTWRVELALYTTLHLVVAIAALTMALLERLRNRWSRDVASHDEEVAAEDARRRAHWLHDEVCTRLGFVQRQVEQGLP